MKQNLKKEAHGKEDFPEILEGSENKYSVDVQALFNDGRKCKVFYAFNVMCWYYETSGGEMTPVEEDFRWIYPLEKEECPFMDFQQQTDKMREYLIGQIEAVMNSVKNSTCVISMKRDIPLKIALCSPSLLFATNEFYELSSLHLDYHKDRVLCYLEENHRRAGLVPIKHISLDGLNTIVQWLSNNQFINIHNPAPIPITDKFWDFIEQILPEYHNRYDVFRQSELQLFIDGKESSATGLTRKEAIKERDQILYRIYAEAIHTFTRPVVPKEMLEDDTEIDDDVINDILANSNKCEAFMDILGNEINCDEEKYSHKGRQVLTAYLENSCSDMLIALCGWSMESLLHKYVDHAKEISTEEEEEEE